MSIQRKVSAAIYKYKMFIKGDKVAIAFSGGKDSVLLSFVLKERKELKGIFPIHIDNGFGEDIEGIENFLKKNFKEYHIERMNLKDEYRDKDETFCFYCSWKRRKRIFEISYEKGIKKIAYGHNREDAVVTFIMNLFYHGEISTLKPNQEFFGGILRVVRPIYFVKEKEIEDYLKKNNIIFFNNPCPFKENTKRVFIKNLIETFPDGMNNVYKAIFNIKKDYIP